MNVAIVGGGNIGTQVAVHCAAKGHRVSIFSKHPDRFQNILSIVNAQHEVLLSGSIECATSDPRRAVAGADLIFVALPAFLMSSAAAELLPYIGAGAIVCFMPGTGGCECAFREALGRGAVLFGLQRVPSVARLVEYGRCVCAEGYREQLYAAALPWIETSRCCTLMEDIFDMPCKMLPSYLNVTLTPSNPILHTSRLRTIFRDYRQGVSYTSLPLFYGEWDDASSDLLFQLDDEVQRLCLELDMFDLSGVKSLREHYESETPHDLTCKMRSIESLHALPTPAVVAKTGRLLPDLSSRYFTADFPYGLAILVQIAHMVGVAVPGMEETLDWYRALGIEGEEFRFADYGINCFDDFVQFYKL